ncbi:uncharacterized protein VTP21DRAFT_7695 [Calcarisporiella thermophila]|uniref:uncharacterized protein n=1 Tax=Calcarisporiella thermophila TaxID=911321 RepID=UPI003742332E
MTQWNRGTRAVLVANSSRERWRSKIWGSQGAWENLPMRPCETGKNTNDHSRDRKDKKKSTVMYKEESISNGSMGGKKVSHTKHN